MARSAMSLAAGLLLLSSVARAQPPVTLHMAAVAPTGSSWDPILHSFGDEVNARTRGAVRVKWILGGLAGDETAEIARVAEGSLDGAAGAIFCQEIAPSLRVLEVAGLVESDDEAEQVLRRLHDTVAREFRHTSFMPLVVTPGFGHRVLFSRTPVRSLADLRRGRYWVYDLDEVERAQFPLMGVSLVPSPLTDAAATIDRQHLDGFISIPLAAVSYRYFARARYFTDLHSGFLPGCMVMATRSFARLTSAEQAIVRAAALAMGERFAHLGRQRDAELLEQQFPRAGLKEVPMSDEFRADFRAAARSASMSLGPRLVPAALVERVQDILTELRRGAAR